MKMMMSMKMVLMRELHLSPGHIPKVDKIEEMTGTITDKSNQSNHGEMKPSPRLKSQRKKRSELQNKLHSLRKKTK